MSDTFGQGAFDPDAAAVPPQPRDQPFDPDAAGAQLPPREVPPQPGPTFRAPLGPTEQRDPFAQPAWPEIADAAFRKSNSIASTLSFLSQRSPDLTLDPNWNPLTLIKGSEFENQPETFIGDLNKEQTATKMARMRDENKRADILAKSGSAGVAMGLASGVLDPVNYLPIFGEYAAATRFGQVAYDAARLAGFGAATAGVSQVIEHATQETHQWSEAPGNIASAAVLMGMLGGTLGMLAPAERIAAARELDTVRPRASVDPATGEARYEAPTPEPPAVNKDVLAAAGVPADESHLFQLNVPPPSLEGPLPRVLPPDTPITQNWDASGFGTTDMPYVLKHVGSPLTGGVGLPSNLEHSTLPQHIGDTISPTGISLQVRKSAGDREIAFVARGEDIRGPKPEPDPDRPWVLDAWERAKGQMFPIATAKKSGMGDNNGALEHLVVHPDFQGQGLGQKLIHLAETHLGANPYTGGQFSEAGARAVEAYRQRRAAETPAQATAPEPVVRRPQTLLDWLKSNGGIKDEGGELSNRGLVRGYPGLVNNKSGMSLDVARRSAADAGFLGADTEKASAETFVNDLLDRIDQHPTYSIHDEGQRLAFEHQQQTKELKARYADAADEIHSYLEETGMGATDKEHVHEAAQLMVHEGLSADDALEQSAIRSQDSESRGIGSKGIPEHEIPPLEDHARQPDQGGAAGERPGAEGEAGTARGAGVDAGAAPGIPRAVGAAASDQRDLALINFGLNQLGKLSEKTIDKLSPNLRVYTGASLQAKRAMADLAETALKFTQHAAGITTAFGGAPLETIFRTMQKKMQYAAHIQVRDAWLAHRDMEDAGIGQRIATTARDFRQGAPEGKLSFNDFKAAVSDSMRAGDVHAIPQVQETAQFVRQTIFDPIAKMAEETLGPDGKPLLSELRDAPKGDAGYAPRVWNRQAIARKPADFVRSVADWYASEQARHQDIRDAVKVMQGKLQAAVAEEKRLIHEAEGLEKSSKARADLEYEARLQKTAQENFRKGIEDQLHDWGGNTTKDALSAIKKRTAAEAKGGGQVERLTGADSAVDEAVTRILGRNDLDLTREELENLAGETMNRILSTPDGRIPYEGDHITNGYGTGVNEARGSLQGRKFAIPSDAVREFLDNDIERLIGAHMRTAVPDILLTQRFGDVRMTEALRGIVEEYDAKMLAAKTPAEAQKLQKLKDRDIADVTAVRDRLRGTYGWTPDPTMRNVGRAIHAFHNYTTITSLGTSALNRLNDWGMQSIFRNGFMNTLGDMWAPMLKGMLQIDKEGTREIIRQARDMGIGVDGMLGHARYNLADVTDAARAGNTFERGLAWGADRSMIVNLHGPETDYARIFNWVAAQGEFGRVAERIANGSATGKDLARMAESGIDRHMAERIWKQYEAQHNVVGGTRLANTGAWEDTVARDAFERAMQREANINVVQAGIGDKPLFLSRPLGSLVGQFKSFTAGATERILIANLQQGDARTLQGVISGITMGMLGYRLYTLASGQPVSDRPQDWIKEGIIRSGMGGWLMEGNNTLAKFTSGKSDVFRAIGADRPSSRRASESALSDLLGPTFSHLEGLTQALGHATYTDPKTGASAFTARDIHNLRQAGVLPVPPFVFQNLMGLRRIGDEFEDGVSRSLGIKPMNREPRYGPQ